MSVTVSGPGSLALRARSDRRLLPGAWSATSFRVNRRVSFYMAVIVLGSFLGPIEAAIRVGLTLTAMRVALIVAAIPTALELARKLVRGGYVFVLSDAVVILMSSWILAGLFINDGVKGVSHPLGVAAIEFLIAYFVGRCFFGTYAGIEEFLKVLVALAVVLLGLGILDFVARDNVVTGIAAKMFGFDRTVRIGGTTFYQNAYYRFGFVRARASFEHAILYGTFFAVVTPLFYYLLRATWLRAAMVAAACLGVFLALSSAPLASLAIAIVCIGYDAAFNRSHWRWALLGFAICYALTVFFMLVDDPIRSAIAGFTLDPQTGFYRLSTWTWVGSNLEVSPWFGVGTRDWVRLVTMLSSVDSLWLNLALRHGYPAVFLLTLAVIGSYVAWNARSLPSYPHKRSMAFSTAITLALIEALFIAFTVHYWGKMWIFLALLLGIRAGLTEARYLSPTMRDDEPEGLRRAMPGTPQSSARGLRAPAFGAAVR